MEQKPHQGNVGAFIGGLLTGLFGGGIFGIVLAVLVIGLIAGGWNVKPAWLGLFPCWAVGAGLGWLGLRMLRRDAGMNFLSGFLVGSAAGSLGGATICGALIGIGS